MYAAASMWWQYGEGKTTQLSVKTTGVHFRVSVVERAIKKPGDIIWLWNFLNEVQNYLDFEPKINIVK